MPPCRQLHTAGSTDERNVVTARKVPAVHPARGRFQIGSFSVTHYDNRLTADAEMETGPHTRSLSAWGSN